MAAAATQLIFEPRLEGVITALLSRKNPVEIISVPLHALKAGSHKSWRDIQVDLANETGEIAIGVRFTVDGEPRVVLNPAHDLEISPEDEVVILSKPSASSKS
jgi:hypothetical protein